MTDRSHGTICQRRNELASSSLIAGTQTLGSQVQKTVEAATRRRLLVQVVEQSGWVATFVFSGLILLMLAGSLIFHWGWLFLLASAGTALGFFRIRKQLLPPYAVAQILDRRLRLSDTLSTAYYLRSQPNVPSQEALNFQLEQADRLAASIRPDQPFPLAGQKVWSVAGALALVSIGLFGVRYMVTESLSLRPAIVSLQISPIVERIHEILAPAKRSHSADLLPNRPATKAENANGKEAQPEHEAEATPPPPPAVSNASPDGSPAGQQTMRESSKSGAQEQGEAKPGDAAGMKQDASRNPSAAASAQPNDAANKSGNPQPQTKEQRAGSQNTPPGVMNRMKDALSSMMAKMNAATSSQQSKNGQQDATDSKSSQQSQAAGRPQQGNQQQQQSQNQAANQNENAEGQAQGQTSEKQGTTQGKSSDQSAQKGSDAHSGVGQQDGDKDIKNAEQLKAMGKLAEIIGKRSANLTGDMTVETSSGKQQQLKTTYSQRVGQHTDAGGEINHNQVPLAYQQYVREYMEQVRKQDKGNQ